MTLAARVSTRESVSDVLRKTARPGVKLLTGTLTSNTRFPYVGLARRLILHLKVKAPWRVSRCFALNDLLRWWVGHALRVFDGAGRGDVRAPTRDIRYRVSLASRPMPDRGTHVRRCARGGTNGSTCDRLLMFAASAPLARVGEPG